jgi:prepilin-type N-terminal cleavage/methylation domain-containing protein
MKTNRSEFVQADSARRKAFTLLELVVVLGVVAVLIVLEAPVLADNKGQTKIGICASNLRQIAMACQIYAQENDNRLPNLNQGSASWAWDLPFGAAKSLLNYSLTKKTFYCPGTGPRFTDSDNWQNLSAPGMNLWDFGDNTWPPQSATDGYHIAGYIFALAGSHSVLIITNQNATMLPETLKGATVMPAPAASERVLLADANISGSASDNQAGFSAGAKYNFTDVGGGFYKHHVSPHLNGAIPAGGNVAFKDGHVAWRKFEQMDQREASGVGFWW